MAVKIRLKRMGAKKAPFYRVVVADSRYPRDGRFIEQVGTYNPMTNPSTTEFEAEKVQKWIKNGRTADRYCKTSFERKRHHLTLCLEG